MTKSIIEKWYKKLSFDKAYDEEFYRGLNEISIPESLVIENYDYDSSDGIRNLLSYLYMCEETSKEYEKKGISEDILTDTLKDITRWSYTWSEIKNNLCLYELKWLSYHLQLKIFKLGRLQFFMDKAKNDYPDLNIKKGDNVLAVHIPSDGALDIEKCLQSFCMAKEFFKKYFPEFNYTYFSCHSWLLDDSLKSILPESSNIIKFGNLFTKVSQDESYSIIRYVFGWNVTKETLSDCIAETSFARKVKEGVEANRKFYSTQGFLKLK